jgi:glycosyltransferase involved in cell wall biosynthesis
VDSVLAQSFRDWELVISDDGSTDRSAEVARNCAASDPRIKVISNPNGGVAVARTRGFEATNPESEFVIFLDSDDLWFPDSLEQLHSYLVQHPECVSVYGLAQCIDAEGNLIPGDDLEQRMRARVEYRGTVIAPLSEEEPTTFAGLVHSNWVITPGLHLMRRAVFKQLLPFDSSTDPNDDWDLVLRLSRHGNIGFLNRLVLQWRRHPDTLSDTSKRLRGAYSRVRRKLLLAPDNTPQQLRLAKVAYLSETKSGFLYSLRCLLRADFRTAAKGIARSLLNYVTYAKIQAESQLAGGKRPAPVRQGGAGGPSS